MHLNCLEGLIKMQIARCCLCKVSDIVELVWGLRVQIDNKLPGGAVIIALWIYKIYLGPPP